MGPSYARNLFLSFIELQLFSQYNGLKPELHGHYIDDCIDATSSTREELTQFITAANSPHPALKYILYKFPILLWFFLYQSSN